MCEKCIRKSCDNNGSILAEAVGILRYESTKGEQMKAARFLAAVRLEAITVAYVSEAMITVTF